ncbi:hypothetical protein HMPREF0972_02306 [Actinomyces sp. oral taxon 848 str. F0332]|nr:hypothetical protein HMPREF0972_02306 [Actinomyces sp. oral taxon 848 str. F0332]
MVCAPRTQLRARTFDDASVEAFTGRSGPAKAHLSRMVPGKRWEPSTSERMQ